MSLETDALKAATNRVMPKLEIPGTGGGDGWVNSFKSPDWWVKTTKELGVPAVVAGFLLWRMSAFIDVGIKTQERTADAVVDINQKHVEVKAAVDQNGHENRAVMSRQTEVLERIDRGQDRLIDKIESRMKPQ